jgi:hypothetical protein
MKATQYFNYVKAAQEQQVPSLVLQKIEREVQREFPTDRMMYELHVLRAVQSGYWRTPAPHHHAKAGKPKSSIRMHTHALHRA